MRIPRSKSIELGYWICDPWNNALTRYNLPVEHSKNYEAKTINMGLKKVDGHESLDAEKKHLNASTMICNRTTISIVTKSAQC